MQDKIKEGEALFAEGKIEEAEKCFWEILKHDSKDKEVYNNLGVIAFQRENMKIAKDYFLKSLKIDPFYQDALDNLDTIRDSTKIKINHHKDINITDNTLTNARIAIIKTFNNKFNEIYASYFSKRNEVQIIKPKTEQDLSSVSEWADIIWCTWCNEPLVYLSHNKKSSVLVTHIRSYEILTSKLMKNVKWQNIDGVMFVADHIREIANQHWENQLSSIPQATIYNCVELEKYPLYKNCPGKNIAYVGYLNHKKGVGLLLQCIQKAVEIDPDVRLHIAGVFQEMRFQVYMEHLLKEMGIEHHVVFHGWVPDVPAFLKGMNYVVSTSPWEGCPNNIIETMACGVKPLIHNWRGAKELFPEELVFNTVEEFLSIILSADYQPEAYRSYVEEHFNAEHQLPKIDKFLYLLLAQKSALNQETSEAKKLKLIRKIEHPEQVSKSEARTTETSSSIEKEEPSDKKETIDFCQKLPANVELTDNRKRFVVEFCKRKNVLHIGCVDTGIMERRMAENNHLHFQINTVANRLVGIDINEKGIEKLKQAGFDAYVVDIGTDGQRLTELVQGMDVIVIPEVIEHLNNVGQFLTNLRQCDFRGDILISTPNSFSYPIIRTLSHKIELVHPDHNYYFSLTTLTTLLRKHSFEVMQYIMYYWPSNDEFGNSYRQWLKTCPYCAEGIIVIVRSKTG